MQRWLYLESYIWVCECDKDCEICEYPRDWRYAKSLINDLLVTCDEIAHTSVNILINLMTKQIIGLLLLSY